MSRRASAAFFTMVLLSILLPATNGRAAHPDVATLYRQWREWASELEQLSPRKMAYERKHAMLRHFGYSKANVVSYLAKDDHFSWRRVREPMPDEDQEGHPHNCKIYTPQYYALLVRSSAEDGWEISKLEAPREPGEYAEADQYEVFLEFPGDTPRTSASLDELYSYRELGSSDGEVRAEFVIKNVKPEVYRGIQATYDKFEVTFSKSVEWLPTQIDWHHVKDWWHCVDYSDWKPFEGILVPRLVTVGPDREREKERRQSLRIKELSLVSEEEVIERTSLAYYGLPEMDLRPDKPYPWGWIVAAVLGAAALAYVGVRKWT